MQYLSVKFSRNNGKSVGTGANLSLLPEVTSSDSARRVIVHNYNEATTVQPIYHRNIRPQFS